MSRRLNIYYLLILSILIFLMGCNNKKAGEDNQVTIGILQHGSSIPFVVAQKEGLFEKQGINVKFKTLTPAQHMPSLLSGDVQLLSPSSFPVIFSTAQQNPNTIIGYMTGGESMEGDILYGIVVKKSSNATSLGDLVGKTIGSASKFTVVNLRNVLGSEFNDKIGQTTIREIADKGTLLDSLRKGTVDAVIMDQPLLSSKEVIEEFKIIESNFRAKYLGNPYWSGSGIANKSWVSENEIIFNKVLSALDEALSICNKTPEIAKQMFISYFEIQDLKSNRIGMYVYPGAKFAPSEDFCEKLAKTLMANGMLGENYNFTNLFYR